jgi:cell division protein FtsZ
MNAWSKLTEKTARDEGGARYRFLGVGGAGGRVVEHLAEGGFDGSQFAVLNTEAEALRKCRVGTRLQLGARLTRGLGAGGDPEVGRVAVEESAAAIQELCRGAELVFLVAGLGGGTGTGAAPAVARLARESGALVVGLVTLPFACEGSRRQRQAQRGLVELRGIADVVLCLPNQRMLSLVDENTSLVETFQVTDRLLEEGARAVWRLAGQPGLIHVDVADLRELLRDRHAESFFATAEGQGEGRSREVVERLLLSPLLENGALLREADGVLASIVAGSSLSIGEVDRIADRLRRECEGVELLLGAAVDPALGDRLHLTFIGTRRPGEGAGSAPGPVSTEAQGLAQTGETPSMETDFFRKQPAPRRPRSRFVPPVSEAGAAMAERAGTQASRTKRGMHQAMLPLEIVSRGRFEKSEPTLHRGEDLDVPTFVRRGMVLN